MITVQETVARLSASSHDILEQELIINHFDSVIGRATKFPVSIPVVRAMWSGENVAAVIDKYAAEGWIMTRCTRGGYARVDLPVADLPESPK